MLFQLTGHITLCEEPGSVGQMCLWCWSRALATPPLDSACLPMLCLPSLILPSVCASQGSKEGTARLVSDYDKGHDGMRKVDIVRRIAEDTECTTAQAAEAVEAILATVKEGLQQGDPVILRRFGTFRVRAKRARVGRNPRSGAAAAIAARRVVRFMASPTFKQVVDGTTTAVE